MSLHYNYNTKSSENFKIQCPRIIDKNLYISTASHEYLVRKNMIALFLL